MAYIELWACKHPQTSLYKANREGSCFGEPLGNLIKLYKYRENAEKYGREFSEVVKIKMEVIE